MSRDLPRSPSTLLVLGLSVAGLLAGGPRHAWAQG